MAAKKRTGRTARTKTKGATRAGSGGRYHYKLANVRDTDAGTGYSTSHGGVLEGALMLVGWIH